MTTSATLTQRLVLTPCAAAVATVFLMANSAYAQEAQKVERVEVTGSSIKRIEGETALPVQVLKREDIEKTGATTASDLLKTISGNAGQVTDGASITDSTSGQRGLNGANLRGLGVSSTLILLNGRRLANFATPGDNAGVDLNNIPAAAIQRVEILKDGASAIYGTDAIGGVVNFITSKDYVGADISAYVRRTQHGGDSKDTFTVSGGFGSLNKQGFNVFGVLDYQDLGSLRSNQRDFIREANIPGNLPGLLSSRPYPANIRITNGQRRTLGLASRTLNPTAPNCSPPASVYAASGPAGSLGCNYDYMADTEIDPASKRLSFLGRAVVKLNDDHQLFAEVLHSDTKTRYVSSPNPINITGVPTNLSTFPTSLTSRIPGVSSVEVRLRMTEAGNRTNEVQSTGQRFVFGASGVVAGWDYDTALNFASNKVTDSYVDGYVLFTPFVNGIRTGVINPFGPSSQAGRDLINSIKVNDDARNSKGTTNSIDFKASRALSSLAGGDLALALGAEFRREKTDFTPSALLISNEIAGDRDGSGTLPKIQATTYNRNVSAVFAELNAPFTKQVELQLALRHDRYSGIGSTTNPKASIRWTPTKEVLVRASGGTGFRAPSSSELFRPTVFGVANSILPDPVQCAANAGDLSLCADQWPVERRANPNLKPEKSQQFSLGALFEPNRNWSFSVDYWNIEKKDVIKDIGEEVVLANPTKYASLITRDSSGFITNIVLQKENQGRLKTSGVDFGADFRSPTTNMGKFSVSMTGTYIMEYKVQAGPGEEYISNLGRFLNDKAIQRWRHRVSLGWDYGNAGLTLANTYYSGYTDQNSAIDLTTGNRVAPREVSAYSLWDLTGSYSINKNLKLRGGILNLLDTKPPFSNQAYYFLAGYDPSYADPKGRTFYMSLSYKFR